MRFAQYEKFKDCGIEWLGEIPKNWNVKKFRHVFRESPEKIGDMIIGPMLSVSGYRGIEIKEYNDENQRRLDEDLVGYRIVRKGQLVVNTMWLNYAGLGVSNFEGHVSPAYRSYWISEETEKRFVHYLMRSDLYVKGYTKFLTGIRPNSLQMSREDLMVFPIIIPPKTEQTTIATFLDCETAKIDTLVSEQQRLIELLKEKRQAVISHAVTKGLNPNVPMKDSGVEWLGEVPNHWEISLTKRFFTVRSGDMISSDEETERGVPIIGGNGLRAYASKWNAPGNTLVIGRVGAHCGCVHYIKENFWASEHAFCVIGKRKFSNKYFFYLLTSIQYNKFAIKTAQPLLNTEIVETQWISVPPLTEQTVIATFLDCETAKIDSLIEESSKAIALLQERRNALISAAVTGKIDVRGINQAVS